MIEAVPNAVAVANASEQIKRAARWEIGPSADDSVADAVFEIAACAKTGQMPSFMRA
jgi:hydroxymethylpyrimidine pyrophosphatase-like HAD family hydrolase